MLAGGGYAERVAVPAAQLLPIPAGVDLVTAGGLPEVACTVWSNIVAAGRLSAGETFLIQGGSSGIGSHAIQVAKALGARVAATAGAPDRLQRCRELGADIVIDYHDDIPAELKEATDGHGADVILDNMGAAGLAGNVEALAPDGRLLVIGMQGGTHGRAGPGRAAAQAGQRDRDEPARAAGRGPERQGAHRRRGARAGLADDRRRAGAADRARPAAHGPRAAEAHAQLEAGGVVGKLLLVTPRAD